VRGAGSPPPEVTGMSFSNLEHGRMMRPMALNGHPLQNAPTRRSIATSVLIFVCYCTIGLQLAVVPGFAHLPLGYHAVVAGLAMSAQYVATLSGQPIAGRMGDSVGAKQTTCAGGSTEYPRARPWYGVGRVYRVCGSVLRDFRSDGGHHRQCTGISADLPIRRRHGWLEHGVTDRAIREGRGVAQHGERAIVSIFAQCHYMARAATDPHLATC
jgi:hypothetical protein